MENINLTMIPQTELDNIKSDIQQIKELLRKKSESDMEEQWLSSTEARKMLGVSGKTWQVYRDKRIIPFSQFGRKIKVKKVDIEAFLQDHFISSK